MVASIDEVEKKAERLIHVDDRNLMLNVSEKRKRHESYMDGRTCVLLLAAQSQHYSTCMCVCVCLSDGEGFGDYFITRDLQLLHPEEPGDT